MRNYAPQLVKAYELASSVFYEQILEEERRLAYEYDKERTNNAIILYNEETKQVSVSYTHLTLPTKRIV